MCIEKLIDLIFGKKISEGDFSNMGEDPNIKEDPKAREDCRSLIEGMEKADVTVIDKCYVLSNPVPEKRERKGISGEEAWNFIKETMGKMVSGQGISFDEIEFHYVCRQKGLFYNVELSAKTDTPPLHCLYTAEVKQRAFSSGLKQDLV